MMVEGFEAFKKELFQKNRTIVRYPATSQVCKLVTRTLTLMYPEQSRKAYQDFENYDKAFNSIKTEFCEVFTAMPQEDQENTPEQICDQFFNKELPKVYALLQTDLQAIVSGDPAAKSEYEVLRAYPGFYAIAFYRIANAFFRLRVPFLPRIITEYAHSRTGIDIHPGANIDSHFFIDHGTGIVIGETCRIGKHVKLYQGVTLGALSVDKGMAETIRHPKIEDNVVIYANATILGGKTVIGHDSVLGGSVWITRSLPPHSTVYHKPQVEVRENS